MDGNGQAESNAPHNGVAGNTPQNSLADRVAAFRWQKGASGNPAGRPRASKEVREALKEALPEAVETLVKLLSHKDGRLRYLSATAIIERVAGRVPLPLTGRRGEPLIPGATTIINNGGVVLNSDQAQAVYMEVLGNPAIGRPVIESEADHAAGH